MLDNDDCKNINVLSIEEFWDEDVSIFKCRDNRSFLSLSLIVGMEEFFYEGKFFILYFMCLLSLLFICKYIVLWFLLLSLYVLKLSRIILFYGV